MTEVSVSDLVRENLLITRLDVNTFPGLSFFSKKAKKESIRQWHLITVRAEARGRRAFKASATLRISLGQTKESQAEKHLLPLEKSSIIIIVGK